MDVSGIPVKGYLNEEFRIFHNKDRLGVSTGLHFHNFHKITLIKEGEGSYMVDGKNYDVRPGDIIMVGMNIPHQPYFAPERLYDRYTVYISPGMVRDIDIFSLVKGGVLRFSPEDTDRLLKMAKKIEDETRSAEYASKLASRLGTLNLLIEIGRCREKRGSKVRQKKDPDDKMLRILRYINDRISDPPTIDELSEQFFISKYHMMRLFKAEYGCSIHEYISERRLLTAREMLEEGKSPARVCYDCGYGSYSAFARAYKGRFKSPPASSVRMREKSEMLISYYPE